MKRTAENLLKIARAEIGYREKETNANLDSHTGNAGDGNYTKYARDLAKADYYQASKQGYDWCDMFVDWCFLQLAGSKSAAEKMQCQSGPYGAGCWWSAKYYKDAGRFTTEGPKPGDQIFFNNYAHTGIVDRVSNGRVYTIEGNYADRVVENSYVIGEFRIDGYGHPIYDAAESKPDKEDKPKKSVTTVAREVLRGKWGNGAERKRRLEEAGYDYAEVQSKVNSLASGSHKSSSSGGSKKKSTTTIAKEVLEGKWGNGSDRKRRLEAAGYDYDAVQRKVNDLVEEKEKPKKSVTTVAREVLRGKWGNGNERKQRLTAAGYDYDAVQRKVDELMEG